MDDQLISPESPYRCRIPTCLRVFVSLGRRQRRWRIALLCTHYHTILSRVVYQLSNDLCPRGKDLSLLPTSVRRLCALGYGDADQGNSHALESLLALYL